MIIPSVYNDFSNFLSRRFPRFKVQKLSINAGFTCPNRDGTKGTRGCTYCNNYSFSPSYTGKGSITSQIEAGKAFFSNKYPEMKYLAYFQSYTNTYGEMSELIALYEEAIHCPDVVGIIIGTRPDCISTELLKYLEALSKKTFVFMEYGVESTKDATLDYINRGHSFSDSQSTIIETAERGIYVGAHLIIGLPGEEQSDYITHIKELSKLPITSLKLHQLQILKGTQMATDYKNHPERFTLFTPDRYIDTICLIIRHLRPSIYVDRFVSQSPREMLIAPNWGIKNYQFTHRVIQKMRENGWHQGDLYQR